MCRPIADFAPDFDFTFAGAHEIPVPKPEGLSDTTSKSRPTFPTVLTRYRAKSIGPAQCNGGWPRNRRRPGEDLDRGPNTQCDNASRKATNHNPDRRPKNQIITLTTRHVEKIAVRLWVIYSEASCTTNVGANSRRVHLQPQAILPPTNRAMPSEAVAAAELGWTIPWR